MQGDERLADLSILVLGVCQVQYILSVLYKCIRINIVCRDKESTRFVQVTVLYSTQILNNVYVCNVVHHYYITTTIKCDHGNHF